MSSFSILGKCSKALQARLAASALYTAKNMSEHCSHLPLTSMPSWSHWEALNTVMHTALFLLSVLTLGINPSHE